MTLRLLCMAGLCLLAVGCAASPKTLLFDAAHPLASMPHVTIAADPFATSRPDHSSPRVLAGGKLGKEEPYQNKGTFLAAHFTMPASGKAHLLVEVAMTELTELKVEVWGKSPAGQSSGMKFRTTLPVKAGWQAVNVPIDAAKVPPGTRVNDITIFQVGKNPAARLYIRGVWLVSE